MPTISVLMPVYNQERHVADAVRCVLAQTCQDFEFIIVDDGSTDRTVEILKEFDDDRIRLIHGPHRGLIGALTAATLAASGKWLARMDSDDLCPPDRFEKQLAFLTAHPECVFLTTIYGIVTPKDRFLLPRAASRWQYIEARDITLGRRLHCDPATFYDRQLAVEIGYDPDLESETPLWYGLLASGKGVVIDEPLYFVRWRLGSFSRGQLQNAGQIQHRVRSKYDRDNFHDPAKMRINKLDLKHEKRAVYYCVTARDMSSARQAAYSAWRRHPLSPDALKLVLIAGGMRRWNEIKGPCDVTFIPSAKPAWFGRAMPDSRPSTKTEGSTGGFPGPAPERLRISVIVPVYNGAKFLPSCLDAIFATDDVTFEVIVIDDGSTDESARISRDRGASVVPSERPKSGPAAARNLGAGLAKGEILLFVDADVVVAPGTLKQVADRFEEQPEISALFGSYDDKPAEKNFLSQYKNLQHHFVHQNSSSEASTFWSGLGAIRRDVFLSAGGFDCSQFQVPSIEDIELGVRLRQAGHRILLAKDIQATHLKKWEIVSLLRTEIFCRAIPWSKLILTRQGMINDMNLKTADRASALLVALLGAAVALMLWKPAFGLVAVGAAIALVYLNGDAFRFFAKARGAWFAALTFPWLLTYFFYSGTAFVLCWFRYKLLSPRLRAEL